MSIYNKCIKGQYITTDLSALATIPTHPNYTTQLVSTQLDSVHHSGRRRRRV